MKIATLLALACLLVLSEANKKIKICHNESKFAQKPCQKI